MMWTKGKLFVFMLKCFTRERTFLWFIPKSIFCYMLLPFTILLAYFCARFMGGCANFCGYLHICLEKELQQNRKEA